MVNARWLWPYFIGLWVQPKQVSNLLQSSAFSKLKQWDASPLPSKHAPSSFVQVGVLSDRPEFRFYIPEFASYFIFANSTCSLWGMFLKKKKNFREHFLHYNAPFSWDDIMIRLKCSHYHDTFKIPWNFIVYILGFSH